jgi:Helix-turn-helix of DDE superfamily endonuclease/DDE superfamily endonuclease
MMTYTTLQSDRRKFLALTGLTVPEFQLLLPAFSRAYQRLYPADQTVEGQPRQRTAGGGCKGLLHRPEEKLLFILVYLKTYPLQVVMGELFDLSQPQANHWIHRLLPVLQAALDDLGVCPERDPSHFAQSQPASEPEPRLIIDSTERRRQRPKNPEKQALHYSGRRKIHCDKNVVIADVQERHIGFLSRTYVGKTSDKKIADEEGISYPPGTVLYKDAGFQGYEPGVQETRPAKKKATPRDTHPLGETNEPKVRTHSGPGGACSRGREALSHCQRRPSEYQRGGFGFGHGSCFGFAQPPSSEP